jgi:hypothetical protein
MRHYKNDDDDIIQDGKSIRVPIHMMDGMDEVQRAVAGVPAFDAAAHRPGYRSMIDTAAERRATYDDYKARLSSAWRTPVADAPLPKPDASATDPDRDAEYEAMKDRLQNAWRVNHRA